MKKQSVYRYRYLGESACYTIDPALEWRPGDVKVVDRPIHNALFVPAEDPAPAKEAENA
jgi:hypothetical protein